MARKAMTKTELMATLAEKTGLGKGAAGRVLDALAEIVTQEVAEGGAVTLPGLGKFARVTGPSAPCATLLPARR